MKKKRGFTILYIPETEKGRSVQLHLSYSMTVLLATIGVCSILGVVMLIVSFSRSADSSETLLETIEMGQYQREFERDLRIIERRIDLLEIHCYVNHKPFMNSL